MTKFKHHGQKFPLFWSDVFFFISHNTLFIYFKNSYFKGRELDGEGRGI